MKYTVFIERYAQKQILKLDKKIIPVIKKAIQPYKPYKPYQLLSRFKFCQVARTRCVPTSIL